MKRVLFVDDDPKVLDGLKRMLYPYRKDWDMVFAASGQKALEQLDISNFDVVITDVRMPEMNGIELLAEVRERHPQVVRMVLSGAADQELTISSATVAHQYLAKPCDPTKLRETVERALNLRVMLDDPALKEVVSRIHSLPSIPMVYRQLMEAVQSPDTSPKEIGRIVARDVAMTAKVLQLVNSAFFGTTRRITNPTDAVIYLGTSTIRALALTVSVFSQFDTRRAPSFSLEALCNHSFAVATFARQIATSMGLSAAEVEDAFLGGLLHELGKLVLACHYPEQFEAAFAHARQQEVPLEQGELAVFGTTDAHIGAYLLWLWGMPDDITGIVAQYSYPGRAIPRSPVVAVHVANALLGDHAEDSLDTQCLSELGLIDRVSEWKHLRADLKLEAVG